MKATSSLFLLLLGLSGCPRPPKPVEPPLPQVPERPKSPPPEPGPSPDIVPQLGTSAPKDAEQAPSKNR